MPSTTDYRIAGRRSDYSVFTGANDGLIVLSGPAGFLTPREGDTVFFKDSGELFDVGYETFRLRQTTPPPPPPVPAGSYEDKLLTLRQAALTQDPAVVGPLFAQLVDILIAEAGG